MSLNEEVCSCAPAFNLILSLQRWAEPKQNDEVKNTVKLEVKNIAH